MSQAAGNEDAISRAEALLEVMLLMSKADGAITRPEMLLLSEKVTSLEAFAMFSREFVAGWVRGVLLLLDHVDRLTRLRDIRRRLPSHQDRMMAISLAVEVLEADGEVHMAETELLKDFMEALEIDSSLLPLIIQRAHQKKAANTVMV